MSLILDALKKSEAERQRGQVPNLLSPLPSTPGNGVAQKKPASPWLIVVAVLSAVLVGAYFYLRKQDVDSVDATTPQAVTTSTQANLATSTSTPATPAAPVPEPEPAPLEKPPAAVAETSRSLPAVAPVQAAAPELPAPQPATPEPVAESEPRVAGMAEMPVDQRQQLPALKLSMHVYSTDAGKRFAIIDGQRVNEGSVLGTAVVEKIRQDGVVLSVQGQSYLLPRP